MLSLNNREKELMVSEQKAAEAARLEALAEEGLTDKQKAYLAGKSFSNVFLNHLTRGEFNARIKCINEAKDTVIKDAQYMCMGYNDKLDAIIYKGEKYFFGKIPEEFAPGKTISNLTEVVGDGELSIELCESIAYYLSMYWVKPDTFEKAVAAGYAIVIPKGMSVELATEYARFNITVAEYKAQRGKLNEDIYFLRQILNATSTRARRDLYLEGLLDDIEDTSRSADAEREAEFFANLDEDSLILWYLSKTMDKIIRQVDPFMELEYDYTHFYKLDELVGLVKTYKGIAYKNFKGEEKKLNDFSLLFRFYPYVENKFIDTDVLKYIVGCNDWVLNKFLEIYDNAK